MLTQSFINIDDLRKCMILKEINTSYNTKYTIWINLHGYNYMVASDYITSYIRKELTKDYDNDKMQLIPSIIFDYISNLISYVKSYKIIVSLEPIIEAQKHRLDDD